MNKYVFHSDAGHAWLECDRSELERFVDLSEVSSCSYQKGGKVYLEEDCDAGLFLQALRDSGIEFEFIEKNHPTDSPIRKYERFRA